MYDDGFENISQVMGGGGVDFTDLVNVIVSTLSVALHYIFVSSKFYKWGTLMYGTPIFSYNKYQTPSHQSK